MALLKSFAGVRLWRVALSWGAACAVAIATPSAVCGAAPPPPISAVSQLEAVFLFNFTQFVEWPEHAFAEPKAPIVIGVLGEDPFGSYFDSLVQGEKIRDRTLVVRRFARLEEVTACHIVFISRSEAPRYDKILSQLKGRPVLTVGDVDGFAKQGGMIRFAPTENGKIQLRVNVAAVKAANLIISSKLLAHATVVSPGRD